MTYRLAETTRITATPDAVGDANAVLVDSRNFTAHHLTRAAYLLIQLKFDRMSLTDPKQVRHTLGLSESDAESATQALLDEMVERGWAVKCAHD